MLDGIENGGLNCGPNLYLAIISSIADFRVCAENEDKARQLVDEWCAAHPYLEIDPVLPFGIEIKQWDTDYTDGEIVMAGLFGAVSLIGDYRPLQPPSDPEEPTPLNHPSLFMMDKRGRIEYRD